MIDQPSSKASRRGAEAQQRQLAGAFVVRVRGIWISLLRSDRGKTPMVLWLCSRKSVLDEYLRWPGCELMLMGGYAALQLGPVARNLAGARMAGDRLVRALTKPSLARVTL